MRCVRTKYFSPKGPNGGEIQCAFADDRLLCLILDPLSIPIFRYPIDHEGVHFTGPCSCGKLKSKGSMREESADIARPRRSALAAGKRPSTRVVKCDAQCTERHRRADFIGSGATLAYLRGGHTGWGDSDDGV